MFWLIAAGHLESMLPIVLSVIVSEVFVDCVKHAFITKFNSISPDVYRTYRLTLAKDLTDSRSKRVKKGFLLFVIFFFLLKKGRSSFHLAKSYQVTGCFCLFVFLFFLCNNTGLFSCRLLVSTLT